MPLLTCTMPEDLVNENLFPLDVTEVLKYILMSACSLCYPHMAPFCLIIMLSSVFCVFGTGHPPSAVPSLLKQPSFVDSSCNTFLSQAHHCQVMPYKLI